MGSPPLSTRQSRANLWLFSFLFLSGLFSLRSCDAGTLERGLLDCGRWKVEGWGEREEMLGSLLGRRAREGAESGRLWGVVS